MRPFESISTSMYYYRLFLGPAGWKVRYASLRKRILNRMLFRDRPDSVEIGLTYLCQMDCVHCGVSGQEKNEDELVLSETKDILRQVSRAGAYMVILGGGEPLLNRHVADITEYSASLGLITGLSTNGYLLDDEMAVLLKKAGLCFANISIDSREESEHDSKRGCGGSFERAVNAIASCRMSGISSIVSAYATRTSLYDGRLRGIIELAREKKASGVRIIPAVPCAKWENKEDLLFEEEDRAFLREMMEPTFVRVEGMCNRFTECNAALKRFFYISPYGEVQPCSFVPVVFGNIRQRSLLDIRNEMISHGFFNDLKSSDCIMRDENIAIKYKAMFSVNKYKDSDIQT